LVTQVAQPPSSVRRSIPCFSHSLQYRHTHHRLARSGRVQVFGWLLGAVWWIDAVAGKEASAWLAHAAFHH
jgi:hypothetical protein